MVGALAAAGVGLLLLWPVSKQRPDAWEAHLAENESRLTAVWRSKHVGAPLPRACAYPDDASSGFLEEHVSPVLLIANDRFGIALFAPDGGLLAYTEGDGCGERPRVTWYNASWTGVTQPVTPFFVRRDEERGCHEMRIVTVYVQRGETIAPVAKLREREYDGCGWDGHDGVTRGMEVLDEKPSSDQLVVRYERWASTSDKRLVGECTLRLGDTGRFVPVDRDACAPVLVP